MVTQFEQALNLLDAAQNTIRMAMQYYETEDMIVGVLWGADHMLDEAVRSLQIIEAAEETKAEDELPFEKISFEELAAKQYMESEEKEAAEQPDNKETTEEPAEKLSGGVKKVEVDLKAIHKLRMAGKKAKEIADSYGVSVYTVYGWFDKIKKTHPSWAEEWIRR